MLRRTVEARRSVAGTDSSQLGLSLAQAARDGLSRASEHLRSLQHEDGHWRGLLETNVTMDAEDLLLREFLGIRDERRLAQSARHIRAQQREDGTWANFAGGPGDLSTTIEAYWALKLAGDAPEQRHMARAAEWIRAQGGLRGARVFTHIWMALFGLWPWDEVPALPPELMFLPSWFPLNPYDFACWARQTIVALTIVRAHRPVRPAAVDLDELGPAAPAAPTRAGSLAGRVLVAADRLMRLYEHRPLGPLRRLALTVAERWTVARQEADGGWGGIQPPWVYSLMALHLQGYPLEHPVMAAGLRGLDGFTIRDERGRRLEACQSPVWDTALAVIALDDAGLPPDHPAQQRAGRWLVEEEVRVKGDWSVRRPRLAPGGWAFEFANDNYPDVDDTAEVVLALRRLVPPEGAAWPWAARARAAIDRAVAWVEGMQSANGGWAAFDADNTRALVGALPFCDFGEVIDPPSADVTAHTIEMLAAEPGHDPARLARGLAWLCAEQEADGAWFGRWGVNYIYGTGAAVPALVAAGVDPADPRIRRAVAWLEQHQQADGGWGEDLRSYRDPATRGTGATTASQTAWALLALLAAGETGPAVERGINWLVEHQRPDGTWDEPWYTGTGFPWDFSINYHLYRLVFPIIALGRWARGSGPGTGRRP